MSKIVIVEGNISGEGLFLLFMVVRNFVTQFVSCVWPNLLLPAGKSTLVRELEALLKYRVFLEPTLSNPYLNDFYRGSFNFVRCCCILFGAHCENFRSCAELCSFCGLDPKSYALKMQLWLLRNRFRTYITALRHIESTGSCVSCTFLTKCAPKC